MTHRAEGRPWLRTALGVVALVVFFAVMLVVIAVLAFSVKVSGHSMEPTLADGDRLVVNPFGADDVTRFDVVESTLGDREIPVVKRVIGMPGDRIQASVEADAPVVRVKPAGEETVYVVANPAWSGQVGDKLEPCCAEEGTTLPRGKDPRWVTVPDGQFWLVGDNWGGSDDSRTFGFVTKEQVTARISFRVQPLGDLGRVPNEVTLVPEE